jgi:hypothetical protein
MQAKENLATLCGLSKEKTELDFSGQGLSAGDVMLIANDISDMGTLTSLNMSANGLKGAEAGKALGDAIASNTVLKELDISGVKYGAEFRRCDAEFLQIFSVGLRDNGTLSSLNLASNHLCGINEYGYGTYDASGNACFHYRT